jgi:hypothetical protein
MTPQGDRRTVPRVVIARSLATLAATILLAPAFTYVVLETLKAETFAPGQTLAGLADGMPVDLVMMAGGLGFGLLAGAAGGLVALARPRSPLALVLDLLSGLGVSLPVYWMGFAILMLVASNTGILIPLANTAANLLQARLDPTGRRADAIDATAGRRPPGAGRRRPSPPRGRRWRTRPGRRSASRTCRRTAPSPTA